MINDRLYAEALETDWTCTATFPPERGHFGPKSLRLVGSKL